MDLMDGVFSKIHKAGYSKEEILEHVGRLRFYEQSTKAVKAVVDSANAHSIIILTLTHCGQTLLGLMTTKEFDIPYPLVSTVLCSCSQQIM